MPATSRQGESGSRRSVERPGRLALEVDQLPAEGGAQRLAQVQVAVDALCLALGVTDPGEDLLERGGVLRELGYGGHGGRQPPAHPLGDPGRVDGLGAELLTEDDVHLGHGRAEPLGLAGEVTAHLVGVQVGLGHQVADAAQGEVPAVAAVRRNCWIIPRSSSPASIQP